jgi:hypothetical protein
MSELPKPIDQRLSKFQKIKPFLAAGLAIASLHIVDFTTQFKSISDPSITSPQIELNMDTNSISELKSYVAELESSTGVRIRFPEPTTDESKNGYIMAKNIDPNVLKTAMARPRVLLKLYNARSKMPIKEIKFFASLDGNENALKGEYFRIDSSVHLSIHDTSKIDSILTHELSHGLSPAQTPQQSRDTLKYYLGDKYELLNNTKVPKDATSFIDLKGGLRTYILEQSNNSDQRYVDPNDVLKLTQSEREEYLQRTSFDPAEIHAVPSETISSAFANKPSTPELKQTQLKYITLMANGDTKLLSDEFLDIVSPILDPNWDGGNVDQINSKLEVYLK